MKSFIVTMLILLSILGKLCAQPNLTIRASRSFAGISAEHLQNRFWIDLGKGNRLLANTLAAANQKLERG